jgi:hypothetical protein
MAGVVNNRTLHALDAQVSSSRDLRWGWRCWLLYPVLAVLGLASMGGGYETVRVSLDARAYPMPGQLVDVGGYGLHLNCTGAGSPTVILEPGQGGVSSDFAWIALAVARDSTVCVYDRAGRNGATPLTGLRTVTGSQTCTRCLSASTSPVRTCWPATPSAPSMSSASPRCSPIRSPAWCFWTPPPPNRDRPGQPTADRTVSSVASPSYSQRLPTSELDA